MSATGSGRREAGFTLMEALIALAVFSLVAGLVFPAVGQGAAAAAFQQAASGLRADVAMARAQALRTGEPVELVVAPDGRGYGWTPGPQRRLIAGLELGPADAALRFYPDGSSSGGGLVLAQGVRRASLSVDPTTGLTGASS